MTKLLDSIAAHRPAVISLRRHFHQHPELSGQEVQTQAKIMEELTVLGLKPRPAAKTGVMAELCGTRPGKTVAIRADIDALPLQDECGTPYQSVNPGVCHACGHDGHTAMLLGLAKTLVDLQSELPGTVRFLFQPSEERFPGGALAMIEDGALTGVDYIIGAHLWQPVPVGCIGLNANRLMASPDEFKLTIQGRGGHGSMPHQTVDALLVGAQIAVALQTIVSRSIDPLEQAVVSLGVFQSGDTFNIIPDSAVLKGTVRTFDAGVRDTVFTRIEQIAAGICQAAGATYQLDRIYGFPPVINHPEVAAVIQAAGRDALGSDNVLDIPPVMGGEDFSHYLQHVPGAFYFVGIGNPEKGITYPHHHPKFDMDEAGLSCGIEVMARTALKLLAP